MEQEKCWKARPKRKITRPCLDYSQVLLREEEQALKRALYVSLRDTKSDPYASDNGKINDLTEILDIKETNDLKHHPMRGRKRGTGRPVLQRKRRKMKKIVLKKESQKESLEITPSSVEDIEDNANEEINDDEESNEKLVRKIKERLNANLTNSALSTASSLSETASYSQLKNQMDESSQDADTERAKKCLQAQRKFAQSQPYSPNSLLIQQMGIPVPERPKTEDFIKFLCLRGTANLPKDLEYLNNPLIPASPLSSDEDEFLPVSPFFKRQIDSPDKLRAPYHHCRSQLVEHDEDMLCRTSEQRMLNPKNLTKLLDEADAILQDIDQESTTADSVQSKSDIHVNLAENLDTCESSSTSSRTRLRENHSDNEAAIMSPRREVVEGEKVAMETALRQERNKEKNDDLENQADVKEDKRFIHLDLSDSSSQESLTEKQSRKKTGKKLNDAAKTRRSKKSRSKEMEGNVFKHQLNSAPIFRPMEQEFKDPIKYIKKIIPFVLKFGICTVVPPAGWRPTTNISDDLRFSTRVQHIHKMADRNSKSARYLKYLKRCLGEKSDLLDAVPQIGSCEVDLQRMSTIFASVGGVAKVNSPKKWQKIADKLHIPKNAQGRVNKLQDIYYQYVLPFDMLPEDEKEKIKFEVDQEIAGQEQDVEADSADFKGKSTSISVFHRIASNAQEMYAKGLTNFYVLENDFWDIVENGNRHVAAVSGEIDTSKCGTSFHAPKSKSGWSLSTLPQAPGSVLKYLGLVPGLTSSSLRFSSVFSSGQWQKTEDDLFLIEYLHTGAKKVWYAVPSFYEQSFLAQKQDKIEASSLCSPLSLVCPLSRAVQSEGQFVVCLPKVYHLTLSSGYCLAESCCFAPVEWLVERYCSQTKMITPSFTFPVEKIILNFAKSEVEKPKKYELLSLLAKMVKEISNAYKESCERLSKAGASKPENINQGKQKHVTANWEVCIKCKRPCYPIEIRQGRQRYCPDHAILRINTEKIDPSSFLVVTHFDEDELKTLITKAEDCIESFHEETKVL